MEQISTTDTTAIKPCLVFSLPSVRQLLTRAKKVPARISMLVAAFLLFSVFASAHDVTAYSATCGAGPQYTVTATIINVNSTSNYRWQWKNTSGAWVCFVNGANTINGNSYNVSGAVFNLTTTPGPIVFTNPNSGLQGLEIRMVISDGSGVDPCTLPAGNTWTSATNHFINVTGTACANGNCDPNSTSAASGFCAPSPTCAAGSFLWNQTINQTNGTPSVVRLVGGTTNSYTIPVASYPAAFSGAVTINITDVVSYDGYSGRNTVTQTNERWRIVFKKAGAVVQSTAYTTDVPDLQTQGYWRGALGSGISLPNGTDEIVIEHINVAGGTTGPGSVVPVSICMSYSTLCTGRTTGIYFNKLDGGTDLPIANGATFTQAQLAGLYNLEASTTGTIGSIKYTITGPTPTSNIENSAPYNSPGTGAGAWTGADGTYFVNLKTYNAADGGGTLCHDTTISFTVTSNSVSLGNLVYIDRNDNGLFEPALGDFGYDGATVRIYADNNDDGIADGAALATQTTSGGGLYNFTGLPAGKYFVQIENVPGWMFKTTVNGGDPDNDIDNDNNGLTQNLATAIIKGGTITLSVGGEPGASNSNSTYDFGIFKTNGLGDFVFLDADADGVQDPGETGIAGVTVNLRNTAGTLLETTTTDANGYYFFYDPAQYGTFNYNIEFITPAGYTASPSNQGDDTKDSDPVGGTITNVSVPNGTWNHTFDAGFYPQLSLGDRVYYDKNDNGTREASEPGIQGVQVFLYVDANNDNAADGAAVQTTTTDATGLYRFNGLLPGNYIVGVTVPAGYRSSTLTGVDPDNNTDLDDNGNNTVVAGEVRGFAITLSAGAETLESGNYNNTYDFGFTGTGSIGDFVWNDLNGNGIQDPGEPGIGGATVTLTYPDGTTITATTDGNGNYLFGGLAPTAPGQSYTVTFTTPAGFTASPSNQGDDTKDSDPVGGVVSGITLTAGQNNTTVDAGFVQPIGSIGDRVWNDVNRNGIQDAGEVGVAGVTVSLYNNAGALVATTFTDALGNYLFTNLPVSAAGVNYQVRFSLPAEYTFSPQNAAGSTAANNSDPSTVTGRTGNITLTVAAKDRTDVDAGIYYTIPARIGDFIWNDLNKNGVQDAGEPGIAGVTVTLYNNAGNPIRTTITDNNGYYQFTDVPVGTYTIGITPPVGYILSGQDVGDDSKDSDFTPATYRTAPFSVTPGTTDLSFDGGLQVTTQARASVGDRVWNDLNNNGLQDAGEPGVPGVTVQLYNYVGGVSTLVGTQVTDAFGNYMFNNVVPSDYYVKFSNFPAGYALVAPLAGGAINYQIDSDVNGALGAGTTNWFSLVADETKVTVDCGIRNTTALSSLGDFVWYDGNKNGQQDPGEAGVPGIAVTLYNATTGAVVKTTTTDANGNYLFTDLANGSYTVGFTSLPSGYIFTGKDLVADALDSDVDPSSGRTGAYTIAAPGTSITTVDAGIYAIPNVNNAKATIGDKVWNDVNGNGVQDAGEPGIAGVTVTLYAGDGTTVIATTTTDGAGNYIFTNLDAGNYVVGFSNLPAGYVFTTQNAGTDVTKDSNPNTGTGKTAPITLAAGEINLTIDAGLKASTPKSALGDKVWFDANANGIQDAGEQGAGGVTVTLFNTAGAAIQTTVTDATGMYLFTDLDAGTYAVGFSNLPSGYTPTTQNAAGSTAANNSDADVVTLKTGNIVLPAATTDLNWDLGIISTSKAALGDYVWYDANNNGIQEATEKGAPGVTVTLYDNAGVAVASTVTDANGFYMFNNLNPGVYTVGFSNIPVNTGFTTKTAAGGTAANNSDVNTATGRTDAVTLAAGQVRTDIDAGLISNFAAVGDFVWYDVNVNGRQDAGEIGVPGVTVTLFDAGGNRVASAVTNGSGRYFINNIPVPATGASFTIGFSDLPINTVGYTIKNAPGATAATNSNANPATGRTDAFTLVPGQVDLTIDAGIITENNTVLPVSFTSLTGTYVNGVSKLGWATLSEQNFSHFEVEYSTDGANFNKLGNVYGAGNSNSRIDYGFNHLQPIAGINYYRLKMVDRDGKFSYSNTVALNVTIKGLTITAVYPNPFTDRVNVGITAAAADKAVVKLFDNAGKLVYSNEQTVQRGSNIITISNLAKLAAGTYVIQVSAGDAVLTKQLMK
jgi:SdrD B-like domain/Secretion system C-terminal sorting domain